MSGRLMYDSVQWKIKRIADPHFPISYPCACIGDLRLIHGQHKIPSPSWTQESRKISFSIQNSQKKKSDTRTD